MNSYIMANCNISVSLVDDQLINLTLIPMDETTEKDTVARVNGQLLSLFDLVNQMKSSYFKSKISNVEPKIIDLVYEERIRAIEHEHELKVDALCAEISRLEADDTKQQIQDIHSIISSKYGSAEIGKMGESMIQDIFAEFIAINPDITMEDTSGITGHGDLSIKYRDVVATIEVKNYKTLIPMAQITKFEKTMESDVYNAGMFISLNTHFAPGTKIKPFDIKRVNAKPVIYISNIDYKSRHILMIAINCLANILGHDEQDSDLQRYVAYVTEMLEDIDNISKLIESQARNIDKMQKQLNKMKKKAMPLINQ